MALAHFHGLYDTIIASLGTSKTSMGKLTSFICTFTVSTGTFMVSTTYTAFIDTAPANTLTTSATNSRCLVAFSQAMQTLGEAAATTTFINAPKDPVLSSSLPCMCPRQPESPAKFRCHPPPRPASVKPLLISLAWFALPTSTLIRRMHGLETSTSLHAASRGPSPSSTGSCQNYLHRS